MGVCVSSDDAWCSATVAEKTALLSNGDANIESQCQSPPSTEYTDCWAEPQSVVQFTCAVYYCEDETEASVDVVRFGDASGFASFDFCTQDYTAKAGQKYIPAAGSHTFQPEQTLINIRIPTLACPVWDASLEFRVLITRVQGAGLGKYLYESRVKILNNDCFPSNHFSAHLERAELPLSGWKLMRETLKMLMGTPDIWSSTKRKLIMDQFYGMHFFITLYLQMYLVDVVLTPHEEEKSAEEDGRYLLAAIHAGAKALGRALGERAEVSEDVGEFNGILYHQLLIPNRRRHTAMVIGCLYVLPVAVSHLFAILDSSLQIPGAPRELLQANLLHKFLYYTEDARSQVKNSEIIMALLRDVHEVIDFGFMKILKVLRIMGKLGCACIFVCAENQMAIIPFLVYPFVLGLWLRVRERRTHAANEMKAEQHDDVCSAVNNAVSNYRLICDFQIRPMIIEHFHRKLMMYHGTEAFADIIVSNNLYAAPWIIAVTIAIFMVIGSMEVETLGGSVSLGAFLATINVFKEVGGEIQEIYVECMEIQSSFGPLKKITKFMNIQTDLMDRMRINRMRRVEGKLQREEKRNTFKLRNTCLKEGTSNRNSDVNTIFAVDHVEIQIHDLTFAYGFQSPLIQNVTASFPQGSMIGIIGPAKEGKATLLRLLGQVLLPREGMGSIFVPPHLRILHVSADPTILNLSLLQNIVLGSSLQKVGGLQRITDVCRCLGFTEDWLRFLTEEDNPDDQHPSLKWTGTLSHTDHARLTLARAFVMNPECLILHKPTVMFDDHQTEAVMTLMRRHVDERGIELPKGSHTWRRPRTIFFSSASVQSIHFADHVYRISRRGFREVQQEDLGSRTLRSSVNPSMKGVLRSSVLDGRGSLATVVPEEEQKLREIMELVK